MDWRGKKLFKEQKHLDAAEVFTEALDLISNSVGEDEDGLGASLKRQTLTLTNNKSDMYEKAKIPDLALHGECTIVYCLIDIPHSNVSQLTSKQLFNHLTAHTHTKTATQSSN